MENILLNIYCNHETINYFKRSQRLRLAGVTASDISGFVPFEQKGQSEMRTFIYKAACDSVTNLSSSHKGRNGIFSWDPRSNHTSFNTEIRNPQLGEVSDFVVNRK